MPIYEYRCMQCRAEYEALRKMSEYDQDILCPVCGGVARRILSAPAPRTTRSTANSNSGGHDSSGGSNLASIINCHFENCDTGISIPRSARVLMRGNTFSDGVKTPVEFRDE